MICKHDFVVLPFHINDFKAPYEVDMKCCLCGTYQMTFLRFGHNSQLAKMVNAKSEEMRAKE